ncbi:MAG: NYN domain-containing protein [Dehalococcoidia bacterium]|nr:NYN domain-containing protein [Dehalococcoidia bacterium]
MVFIDGSNLYHSLKGQFGHADLNFEAFCRKLTQDRRLVRIYYYNAPVDQTKEPEHYQDQQKFFQEMRRIPYLEVRLGRLIYRNWPTEPPYEKGIDVMMTTDILLHCFRNTYDTMIMVGGDTDLADALQAVKDMGKHVEVALFGSPWTSQRLRDVADKVTKVDGNFLKGCWK